VLELQGILSLALSAVLFAAKAFALVDCIARDKNSFARADTLAKGGWTIILALAVLEHVWDWSPLGLLNLAGTLAALVYLAQLRGSRY
jgi:NADH:ubiquinone oxidoreductase subunit H